MDDQPYLESSGRIEQGGPDLDLSVPGTPGLAFELPPGQFPMVHHHIHLEVRPHWAEERGDREDEDQR